MNERWIEAAWENFEEALSQRNWSLARAVIEDVRESYSDIEAQKMMKVLYQAQNKAMNEDNDFGSEYSDRDPSDLEIDRSDRIDERTYNYY